MADKSKGSGMKWLLLLVGGGLLLALAKDSHAAAGGVVSVAPLDQIKEMTDWLHTHLKKFGFSTVPSYVTATSATEEIIDPAGGRNLVQRNQAVTDAFHAFMWDSNAALQFKDFDPAADPARFAKMLETYKYLQDHLTPEFLA